MHRASGSRDVLEKPLQHTSKSCNTVKNFVCRLLLGRGQEIGLFLWLSYPTGTGKSCHGNGMHFKGLRENILVAIAFVLFTREEWNLSWNRRGSVIFWQEAEEWQWTCTLCLYIPYFFPNTELWKGIEKSCKIGLKVGENILQRKGCKIGMFELLKSFRGSLDRVNKYLPKEIIPYTKRAFYLAERGLKTRLIQTGYKPD